jgi:GNAT superfamily N-acetyltransferase
MVTEIVAFRSDHLAGATALWAGRYRAQRQCTPRLPAKYEDASVILPLLDNLSGQAPGVVTIRNGRVIGFLLGFLLDGFRGKRSAYSPEWANTADAEDSRQLYQEMYTALSARWVANGRFTHVISVLSHETEALDALHWLGFGMTAVDATRELSPIREARDDVTIRRAQPADAERISALSEAVQHHLAAPPVFLPFIDSEGREYYEHLLSDPANALWLAYREGEATGYLRIGPASSDACQIIRDAGTTSITGAFTRADVRGQGIGTALLDRGLHWARSAGYQRCAVDFEPQNIPGARFWLKHFQPVCYSLIRHVDERIAWAQADRFAHDL